MSERKRFIYFLEETKVKTESEKDQWRNYEEPDELPYYDKRHHLERSINNQKNHLKVYKKVMLLNKLRETSA